MTNQRSVAHKNNRCHHANVPKKPPRTPHTAAQIGADAKPGLWSGRSVPKYRTHREAFARLLRFFAAFEKIVQPDAMDEFLHNLSRVAWIRCELGQRTLEARQIRGGHSVAAQNVPANLSHKKRLQTSQASGTNSRKLRRIQKPGERMFSRRPKAAAGRLWFELLFQSVKFVHSGKYTSAVHDRPHRNVPVPPHFRELPHFRFFPRLDTPRNLPVD